MGGTSVAGVSFSQIGDSSGYHTDLDNPDRVTPGSLQHSGETALARAQRFGAADLAAAPVQDGLLAANTVPGQVLAYPVAWAVPLALLAVALLGGALAAGKPPTWKGEPWWLTGPHQCGGSRSPPTTRARPASR